MTGQHPLLVKWPVEKPPNFDEYLDSAPKVLGYEDLKFRQLYRSNLELLWRAVDSHVFFQNLNSTLRQINEDFKDGHGSGLFDDSYSIQLVKKSYDSVVDKLYRKNIKNNPNFPCPPEGGWWTCESVFHRMKDLVRGTIVCRYMDGLEFAVTHLRQRAEATGATFKSETAQRDEGHYAHHVDVAIPATIADFDWKELPINFHVELQVATRLQELLYDLTHWAYEKRRLGHLPDGDAWKWDFDSDHFRASYLSHTMHLIDALVVDLRRKRHDEKKAQTPEAPTADEDEGTEARND